MKPRVNSLGFLFSSCTGGCVGGCTGGCQKGCNGCAELCIAHAALSFPPNCENCNYACYIFGCRGDARCDICSGGGGCGSDLFLYFL